MPGKREVVTIGLLVIMLGFFLFGPKLPGFVVSDIPSSEVMGYSDGDVDESGTTSTTSSSFKVGGSLLGDTFFRGFADFNTTNIPDDATINSVKLNLTFSHYEWLGVGGAEGAGVNIYGLNSKAYGKAGAILVSECGGTGSTLLVDNSSAFTGLSGITQVQVDLGTSAKTLLKNNLSQNFFTVCLKFDEETIDDRIIFNTSESGASTAPKIIVDYTEADSTAPNVSIIYPENTTYNFNVSALNYTTSESGSCWWTNDSGVWNSTAVTAGGNFTSLTSKEGSNTWTVYCNDTSNNVNFSSVTFFKDTIPPKVTIISPTATTYTVNSYSINIMINESGYCEYSLDAGLNNYTLTANSSNTGFTSSKTGVANGDYVLYAYCNDTAGNRNDSVNVSFTVTVETTTATPPGGGGGGCIATKWTCIEWSACADGSQTRNCTSDCNTRKTEKQNCTMLTNGTENITIPPINPIEFPKTNITASIGTDKIIYVAAGGIIIILAGGIIWIIWLLILLPIPFFMRRLKHYIISNIDLDNDLEIVRKGKIDRERLKIVLGKIQEKCGELIFAQVRKDMLKFLLERGFLETQLSYPIVITAHFTDRKTANKFKEGFGDALFSLTKKKAKIMESVETASIFASLREISRKRRTEKQIRKLLR